MVAWYWLAAEAWAELERDADVRPGVLALVAVIEAEARRAELERCAAIARMYAVPFDPPTPGVDEGSLNMRGFRAGARAILRGIERGRR